LVFDAPFTAFVCPSPNADATGGVINIPVVFLQK